MGVSMKRAMRKKRSSAFANAQQKRLRAGKGRREETTHTGETGRDEYAGKATKAIHERRARDCPVVEPDIAVLAIAADVDCDSDDDEGDDRCHLER